MASAEQVARDYCETWNRRDWERYRQFFAPQYSYTGADGTRQEGPEAGMAVAQMFATAFPDGKMDVRKIHTAGDTAIVEFTGSGTHNGDLMGIAPTGRKVTMPAVTIIEVRDGKIQAEREYMDMAHMMQQLGVMPAAATA